MLLSAFKNDKIMKIRLTVLETTYRNSILNLENKPYKYNLLFDKYTFYILFSVSLLFFIN